MKNKFLALNLLLSSVALYAQDTSVNGIVKNAMSTGNTDIKVRFIDSISAMRECKDGQVATQSLEKKRVALSTELQNDEQKLNTALNDFKNKAATLSDTAREKEEKRLMKMRRDFETKMQESEDDMKRSMQRTTEQLAKQVEEAVADIAREEKLDAVIDTMTGRVIYTAEKVDLTDKLVAKIDKKADQKLAQSKSSQAVKVADGKGSKASAQA